jgi:hypothetical protein
MLERDFTHLLSIEADEFPPPYALAAMLDIAKPVVACHTGYPRKEDDDGSKGFRKWMCYRFLRPDEQEFEQIEVVDNEKLDMTQPHLWTREPQEAGKHLMYCVATKEYADTGGKRGTCKYSGPDGPLAQSIFRDWFNSFDPPMKMHQEPLYPPVIPLEPNLVTPERVEALHLGCTLIERSVLERVKFRWDPEDPDTPDKFFFQDCLAEGIEVWPCPIVVPHKPREWGAAVLR